MKTALENIQQTLKEISSAEARAAHQKFVPGTKKIYGVRMPELNLLAKEYKAGGFDLVQALWKAGAFEEKILALKILERIAKKDPVLSLTLVQQFSKDIDNWAECDAMGMQALKSIVKTHPADIFALAEKFNRSSIMWQRRLSLVLVEYYTRDKVCLPQINKLVQALEDDQEYYIKKAVVWIKRNIAKGK
ncbi:MAG: DNA alkylation repair protein [Ferruginibacter sp.]